MTPFQLALEQLRHNDMAPFRRFVAKLLTAAWRMPPALVAAWLHSLRPPRRLIRTAITLWLVCERRFAAGPGVRPDNYGWERDAWFASGQVGDRRRN